MADLDIGRRWRAFEDLRRRIRTLEERRKAVDLSPADPRLRLRLGDAFRALGRTDDAIGQYREAALLFERLGFRRHAHAARILILKIQPDDSGAQRDLRFSSNLELARTQAPLPRELRALPPRESAGPVLALPETIAPRSHHPRVGPAPVEDPPDPEATPAKPRPAGGSRKTFAVVLGEDDHASPPPQPGNGKALTSDGVVVDVEVPEPEPPVVKGRPRPKDRRGDPRVEAEGVVRIFRGADAIGRLEDVSESGFFVAGPRFDAGTVLDLVIRTPSLDWMGLARVRVARAVPATRRRAAGVGLRILWADTPTERWIEDFVARSYGTDWPVNGDGAEMRKMADDRRRIWARKAVSLPVVLVSADFEVTGWAMDLSLGGALVQGPRLHSAGRRVEALLWLPGVPAPLRIPSVVANSREAGTGIRFIRLTESQEEQIAHAI